MKPSAHEADSKAEAASHRSASFVAPNSGGKKEAAGARASLLPSVELPKGGGAIRGLGEKLTVAAATGTGSMRVPVFTSPGRSGFGPELELAYDSGAGNGPFGLGWRLSTPAICRKTDKGLPRYVDGGAESDTYVLAGAEDLVPWQAVFDDESKKYKVQRYRPRVEGLFSRIERWTCDGDVHWRVTTRDNVTSVYGQSPAARIVDPECVEPECRSRVFSWLLEETRDDKGNIVRYQYEAENDVGVDGGKINEVHRFERVDGKVEYRVAAQRYLKRIKYGNCVPYRVPDPQKGECWLFEVVFDYGDHDTALPTPESNGTWALRPDAFSSYRAGFEIRTQRLCRRVLMFHRFDELGKTACLVRSTDFSYAEGPNVTYLSSITQAGYIRQAGGGRYEKETRPPLKLGYSLPVLQDAVSAVEGGSLEGLAPEAQWVDLEGEGIPGALFTSPGRAWYFKSNLGSGELAPPVVLSSLPSPAELSGGVQQLTDLDADGRLELARYALPMSGYFERTEEGGWEPFRPLSAVPRVDWNDPNLRFLDVDGDGLPDILITEHDAFVWYGSRGKEGFSEAVRVSKPWDEAEGPAVVFAHPQESIHLADLSGDGLVDIVRVRNGEVCYWPNLGYGRFGRKVTLANSPVFARPEAFDASRIRFADVDGSGTSDIVYLGSEGAQVYFNEAGNSLAEMQLIRSLPPMHSLASVSVVDLLGTGTGCLVWTSREPQSDAQRLLYVDLLGGKKPHLLTSIVNNLGGETRLSYAPSTKYYLQDKAEGRPWLTRLPFPVQVVERIERYDAIAKTLLVTRYRYHHGHWDGHEREFGGFAHVQHWDAESAGVQANKGLFPEKPDVDGAELHLPPVRTESWFHTGAWLRREWLEEALKEEYYQGDLSAPRLPDTVLESEGDFSLDEEREAVRALRGSVLRQEVYAEDGAPEAGNPFTVTEASFSVRRLKAKGGEKHGVFFVHPSEKLELHYERRSEDPRTTHEMVLDVDKFGNVEKSCQFAYPRRTPAPDEQSRLWATLTEASFVNEDGEASWYRVGAAREKTVSELIGLKVAEDGVLTREVLEEAKPAKRIFSSERTLYYCRDLSGPLEPGKIASHGLVYETYQQVLTEDRVAEAFGTLCQELLEDECRYVPHKGAWWAPSGRLTHDPEQFYLPVSSVDAFGQCFQLWYDAYALLASESEDPLGNRVRISARAADGSWSNGNDYRVLQPAWLIDANENQLAVSYDELGRVVGQAVMGKGEGDTLDKPTVRFEYALDRWREEGKPAYVKSESRERHCKDELQEAYSYSDGTGREVMRKVRAEPGPAPLVDAEGQVKRNADGKIELEFAQERWVGSGRTVFDNKGNPLKKYEPFFSTTSEYESEAELVEWGVAALMRYDALGRLVRTDNPDGTHTRVAFDAWTHETWDANDAVEGTPWLAARQSGTAAEQRSADLSLDHARTPTTTHLDALGRVFLTEERESRQAEGLRPTRVELDVQGNVLSVTDALGRAVLTQTFDEQGRVLKAVSADAGESRVLADVAGKPVRRWDARGYAERWLYDELRRPTHRFVWDERPEEEVLRERLVYGERHPEAVARNLRGQPHQRFDGAGLATCARYDLDGNLVESTRRMALADAILVDHHKWPDWSELENVDVSEFENKAERVLEKEVFTFRWEYDALKRLIANTTPDGSETRREYNEAGLLESVDVRVRGAAEVTPVVVDVDYNARGQRERVEHGNGTETRYSYDEATFRLERLSTTTGEGVLLQDLRHVYDAVGNLVEVEDAVSFGNEKVSASGKYVYDALYRLVGAEGREHPGQMPAGEESEIRNIEHPNDLQALQRYWEMYEYDAVGNILTVVHGDEESGRRWTREYQYEYMEQGGLGSNRLTRTSLPKDPAERPSGEYAYDEAGNMTRMPHLDALEWNEENRLHRVTRGDGNVFFAYDSTGQRARKVYVHGAYVEERLYFGDYEVYRRRKGTSVELERQTLQVSGGAGRAVLLETQTADAERPNATPSTRLRYQLENHLGSAMMEVNEDGKVISYEEYFPYGATAFLATRSGTEVSAKRYRYTGKERDEETGLYYHEARYYAAWLGRWTAADPAGLVDGPNLFSYAKGNPVRFVDPTGMAEEEPRCELKPIQQGTGGHSAAELNAAAETVFGEVSAKPGEDFEKEANAIASTIFNRKAMIDQAREEYKSAVAEKDAAQERRKDVVTERKEAVAELEALQKNARSLQREMGRDEYEKKLAGAKERVDTARKDLKTAEASLKDAYKRFETARDSLISAESWLPSRSVPATLDQIVRAPNQYLGYEKGREDVAKFGETSKADQALNSRRWDIAKKVVAALAENPASAAPYLEFRSNRGGTASLRGGRVRIGGNDFFNLKRPPR